MKRIFKFALMAIAMMAVTTTMLTSCGDDSSSTTGSEEDTNKEWVELGISKETRTTGKVFKCTFNFITYNNETISDAKIYYGSTAACKSAYENKSIASLQSVNMTKGDNGYSATVDASALENIWISYMIVVRSNSGKMKFFSPEQYYDGSSVALNLDFESSLTADSIHVKVSGSVPEEVRSDCPIIALCTAQSGFMSGYQPDKCLGEVCKVKNDGTFSQAFNLDRTTKTYTMIFAAGKYVDDTFTYVIYNSKKTFELPKK